MPVLCFRIKCVAHRNWIAEVDWLYRILMQNIFSVIPKSVRTSNNKHRTTRKMKNLVLRIEVANEESVGEIENEIRSLPIVIGLRTTRTYWWSYRPSDPTALGPTHPISTNEAKRPAPVPGSEQPSRSRSHPATGCRGRRRRRALIRRFILQIGYRQLRSRESPMKPLFFA